MAWALVQAMAGGLAAPAAYAQAQAHAQERAIPLHAAPIAAPQPVPMVLAVTLNGEARPDLILQRLAEGRLLLRREDLPALGLAVVPPTALVIDGEPYVALEAIDGLQADLDERTLALRLTAKAPLLGRRVLDARAPRHRAPRVDSPGGFLNWALAHSAQRSAPDGPATRETRAFLEAGARQGGWLLSGNGQTVTAGATPPATDPASSALAAPSGRRFVRLLTTAQRDEPDTLRRWTLGDFFTSAPVLAGSVNLGGLALSRHEGLDPYRLRYPQGTVQGQASLPSDVEVYVDGQRVRTERVRPGEFEIRDITAQQGARAVQVLVRDPFGRVRQYDYALYTSDQLLPRGDHDYQVALGALRRHYGSRNADYGSPAFSAWHRWGARDTLTLGGHAQGRAGLLNAGVTATATLGAAGVLTLGAVASEAGGLRARALLAQYGYYASRWGVGVSARHESPGFAMLDESRTLSHRAWSAALQASRTLPDGGTLSFSRQLATAHPADRVRLPAGWQLATSEPRRDSTLAYARYWPSLRGSLRIAASRLHDSRGRRSEITAGLMMSLEGARLLSTSLRQDSAGSAQSVQLSQPVPPGEGWGWEAGADREPVPEGGGAGSRTRWHAMAQRHARHLQWRGELQRRTGAGATADEQRLSASGGIAWLGGSWHLSRPVQAAHALVQVGELEGVPVRVNGLAMGETDARGRLFVPQVGAWQETEFAIDARRIPIDHTVPRIRQRVLLPERGGAVIDFQARRLQAVVARLLRPWRPGDAGAARPVPLALAVVRLQAGGQAIETATGREGEIYLENLPPGSYPGEALGGAGEPPCRFTLAVPASDEVLVDAGDLRCE